jgi:hypothetical protein
MREATSGNELPQARATIPTTQTTALAADYVLAVVVPGARVGNGVAICSPVAPVALVNQAIGPGVGLYGVITANDQVTLHVTTGAVGPVAITPVAVIPAFVDIMVLPVRP